MKWNNLDNDAQLEELIHKSAEIPQVIFKHSIRCSISSMVKNRLERDKQPSGIDFYYLDLINNRSLSNLVAEKFGVSHESPQVLLIRNGKCVYDESHNGIRMDEIVAQEMLS